MLHVFLVPTHGDGDGKGPIKRIRCLQPLECLPYEEDIPKLDMEIWCELYDVTFEVDYVDEHGNVWSTLPNSPLDGEADVTPAKKPRLEDVDQKAESGATPPVSSSVTVDSGSGTSQVTATQSVPICSVPATIPVSSVSATQSISVCPAADGDRDQFPVWPGLFPTKNDGNSVAAPSSQPVCKFFLPKRKGRELVEIQVEKSRAQPSEAMESDGHDGVDIVEKLRSTSVRAPSSPLVERGQVQDAYGSSELHPTSTVVDEDNDTSVLDSSAGASVIQQPPNPLKAIFGAPSPTMLSVVRSTAFSQASWMTRPRPTRRRPAKKPDKENQMPPPPPPKEEPKIVRDKMYEIVSVEMEVSRMVGRANAKRKQVTVKKLPSEDCLVDMLEQYALIVLPEVDPPQRPWIVPFDPAKREPYIAHFVHPRSEDQLPEFRLKRLFEPPRKSPYWVTLRFMFKTVEDMEYVAKKFYPNGSDLPPGVREQPPEFDPAHREFKHTVKTMKKMQKTGQYSSEFVQCFMNSKGRRRKVSAKTAQRAAYLDYLKVAEIVTPNQRVKTFDEFRTEVVGFLIAAQEAEEKALAEQPKPVEPVKYNDIIITQPLGIY